MSQSAVAALLLAFLISFVLTPAIASLAVTRRLFDQPGERRVHENPIPRLGGLAVFAAVGITIVPGLFVVDRFNEHWSLLAGLTLGSAILFGVGLCDDIRGVGAFVKLLAQTAAAAVVVAFGFQLDHLLLAPGVVVSTGWLAVPLTIIWIVAVTNAFNLIDGLNGLATGIALIACATAALSVPHGSNPTLYIPIAALAGAALGFLPFNFPRARIFLGDSGSLSIGLILAVLLARSATAAVPQHAVVVAVPLFAFMLPFLDTLLAVVRRWLRNAPLSGADAQHIHHRLLALGLSQRRTTVFMWLIAAAFAGFGLVVAYAPPLVASWLSAIGAVVTVILVIYFTNLLGYQELPALGQILMSGPARARRVLSAQLRANDMQRAVLGARQVEQVNAILLSNAEQFGFSSIEFYPRRRNRPMGENGRDTPESAWRFEYPVRGGGAESEFVVAITCEIRDSRPSSAEMVARTLAPLLETWLNLQTVDRVTAPPPSVAKRGSSPDALARVQRA